MVSSYTGDGHPLLPPPRWGGRVDRAAELVEGLDQRQASDQRQPVSGRWISTFFSTSDSLANSAEAYSSIGATEGYKRIEDENGYSMIVKADILKKEPELKPDMFDVRSPRILKPSARGDLTPRARPGTRLF